MRYLVYMPQPEDGQLARRPRRVARRCGAPVRESSVACRLQAPLEEATVRMQLNLCAAKLRTGREAAALAHADKVLELRPEHPKALYRKGQASGGSAPPLSARAEPIFRTDSDDVVLTGRPPIRPPRWAQARLHGAAPHA